MDDPLFLPPPEPLRMSVELPRYIPLPSTNPVHIGLRAAGRTMAWNRQEGGGLWMILSLDLARLILDLRQGIPDAGFRLPDRYPQRLPGPGETNDLVASADLLQSDHPWLDAWIHALLDPELARMPWPRLWARTHTCFLVQVLPPRSLHFSGWLRWSAIYWFRSF